MSYRHILFEIDEHGVALITINRPDKLNALSVSVVSELAGSFERFADDKAIRAAIVTGAGEKAFVAGADIRELPEHSAIESRTLALRGQRVFRILETSHKPSVAAINGFALGGGLQFEASALGAAASTEDWREGTHAFLEKRRPALTGK